MPPTKLEHKGLVTITVRDRGKRPGEPGKVIFTTTDKNTILPFFEYGCFRGGVGTLASLPDFSDGTNSYSPATSEYLGGMWLTTTAGTPPSGLESYMAMDSNFLVWTNTTYYIEGPAYFVPISQTITSSVSSVTNTSVVTNNSAASIDVAQFGFMPGSADASNELYLWELASATFSNTLVTGPLAGTYAISTIYTLSSPVSVPAGGAITIQYEISATY